MQDAQFTALIDTDTWTVYAYVQHLYKHSGGNGTKREHAYVPMARGSLSFYASAVFLYSVDEFKVASKRGQTMLDETTNNTSQSNVGLYLCSG